MDILDKPIVLRLNRAWLKLGCTTVQDALIALNSGNDFLKAAMAIDFQYSRKADGSWDLDNPNLLATPWDQWIKLPIREGLDEAIHTTKQSIRVPTVIIAVNFAKMPFVKRKPTHEAIRERDGNRCQISGKLLTKRESNIDHLTPSSRGGKDTWENLVLMDKKLNTEKGDRTLDEMGWKLRRRPVAPKDIPVSATIRTLKHRDWRFFFE